MKKNTNNYKGVPVWVLFTVVFISLGVSIWALIIANSEPYSFFGLEFNYTKLVELTGLMFTVIGTVFALYFVIIGIDANKKKNELTDIFNTIQKKQADIENIELNYQDKMYSYLVGTIKSTITNNNASKHILDSLYLSKARLATQYKYLSVEIRLEGIRRLADLGEASDVEDLKKIINDPTENEEIIELAKGIKTEIERRLDSAASQSKKTYTIG